MTINEQRTTPVRRSLGEAGSNGLPFPPITCLCPTYGRFERLRDAVACFLAQDYAGEKRLLILNDAPVLIKLGADHLPVTVVNAPVRYPTLGHKRQALLEMAATPLVAHWDDDDLYLPWHLSSVVAVLQSKATVAANRTVRCAKPDAAWYGKGPREGWQLVGVRHSVFEGQMVFDRARALELGGYPPLDSGQAAALLDAFRRAGELHTWAPPPHELSYIYRWADGLHHVSGAGRGSDPSRGDCDFGVGPLLAHASLQGAPRAPTRRSPQASILPSNGRIISWGKMGIAGRQYQ